LDGQWKDVRVIYSNSDTEEKHQNKDCIKVERAHCHNDDSDSDCEIQLPSLPGLNGPRTAHVHIKVSEQENSSTFKIKALHDSGCAKSLIHKRIFDQIPGSKYIRITPLPNIFISSCTGEKSNVLGIASLYLTFQGENGQSITESEMARIYAPLGLDIGAQSPEEIALSLAAGIRAAFAQRDGSFLKYRKLPIHSRS
jgi:hypothetical protein